MRILSVSLKNFYPESRFHPFCELTFEYNERTHENIVSLSKTIDLKGCLAYLKIPHFDTFKKKRWEQTNKLAVRSVLRS